MNDTHPEFAPTDGMAHGRLWSPMVVYGRPRSSKARQWSSMVVQSASVVATGRQSFLQFFVISCFP